MKGKDARLLPAWVVCALVLAPGAAAAQTSCPDLARGIEDAARSGDVATLSRLAEAIPTEPTCADAFRPRLARVAAYGLVKAAQHRLAGGASLDDQEGLLRQSLAVARTWQALAMLGDLTLARRAYAEATALFQEALTLIDDPAATEKAPPEGVIQSLFRKAAESRMLADEYVAAPVNQRSGNAAGLALASVRGWKVERVPIPITFETGSTRFSPKGDLAARDLAAYLAQQDPARITIVGHTDERGSADYNRDLSVRRAQAVADFLRRGGFTGGIQALGRGESEPIALDDPSRYTPEEIWQLNRRVELVRD